MPPAFVLSQDQTLKFDVRICKGGISLANPLILRSLAYTIWNGPVIFPQQVADKRRAAPTSWKRVRHVGQAWLFILSYSHPKAARPRAAAHMSLHRQSQFQRATDRNTRTVAVPRYRYRGSLSVSVGDRLKRRVLRRAPSGEHASKTTNDSRQQPFCNFVSMGAARSRNRRFLDACASYATKTRRHGE